LKCVCRRAGQEARKVGFEQEAQAFCAAILGELLVALRAEDVHVAERLMRQVFACETLHFEPPSRSCHWSVAANRACNLVHKCAFVVPVSSNDSLAFKAALEKEVTKMGHTFLYVAASMADATDDDFFGALIDDVWVDGVFSKMLRDACATEVPTFVGLNAGTSAPTRWATLRGLLDDSRTLKLQGGRRICLTDHVHVCMWAPSAEGVPISRLGFVYTEDVVDKAS